MFSFLCLLLAQLGKVFAFLLNLFVLCPRNLMIFPPVVSLAVDGLFFPLSFSANRQQAISLLSPLSPRQL